MTLPRSRTRLLRGSESARAASAGQPSTRLDLAVADRLQRLVSLQSSCSSGRRLAPCRRSSRCAARTSISCGAAPARAASAAQTPAAGPAAVAIGVMR
jgi:hypothetical protein